MTQTQGALGSDTADATATLVEPRVTLEPSLKRAKILLAAGLKGIVELDEPNTANVCDVPALIVVVTVGAGEPMHVPVAEFVRQTLSVIGSATPPVSADAVMVLVAP